MTHTLPLLYDLTMKTIKNDRRDTAYQNYLAKTEGPDPDENILRHYRLQAGYTMQDLGLVIGLTKQTIIRVEQGVFANIPPAAVKWIWQTFDKTPSLVELSYLTFQRRNREAHKRMFGDIRSTLFVAEYHPLNVLMERWAYPDGTPVGVFLSPTQVAKLLCVPQAALDGWLNYPRRYSGIPKDLLEALMESGYTRSEVVILRDAYIEYRDYKLGLVRATILNDIEIEKYKEDLTSKTSTVDQIRDALNE